MGSFQKIWNLEALIRAHPLVEACVVVGENEAYYSALIAPDKRHLADTLSAEHPDVVYRLDGFPWLNHIEIRAYYCDLIERINAQTKGTRIERFVLLEFDPGKKREQICQEHKHIIESLYQDYIAGVG